MKIKLLVVLTLILCFSIRITKAHANDGLKFDWGVVVGGSQLDTGVTFVSPAGEVYFAGYFSTTVDFDPGSPTDSRTSSGGYDMFISKYSSTGDYISTKTWGGNSQSSADTVREMAWDSNNNLYVLGDFGGTGDLNPDAAVDMFTSTGGIDSFLTKYDASGNYLWTKTWGGPSVDRASTLSFDASENIYIVGEFQSTTDFDPSPTATANLTSNGSYDAYLTKLDTSGNYLWTKTWGSNSLDKSFTVKFDTDGNYYVAGGFRNTVDFDGTGGTDNHSVVGGTLYDLFLIKYGPNDNYLWTKTWGTTGDDWCAYAECVLIDKNNNVYLAGYAGGYVGPTTIDLDPNSGEDIRSLSGQGDVLLIKLNQNGEYQWGKTYGGTLLDLGWAVNIDSHNFLYVSGWFNDTVDFDPTSNTESYTSKGGTDIFINKYDLDGNYYFTKVLGGTGLDRPQKISIYGDNLYLGGFASTSIDMDPDDGTSYSTIYANIDALFIKFNIDATKPSGISMFYPNSFINTTKPSLKFSKAIDASGISSYSVQLDADKARNWSVSMIPAAGDQSRSKSTWKDDDNVLVEFSSESDSNVDNDEINVYFKNLDSYELTEGKHTWKLTTYDNEGNFTSETKEFYIDRNNPAVKNLTIANISMIESGKEYAIPVDQREIAYSGNAIDYYRGSTHESDIFQAIASGPSDVRLIIGKLRNSKTNHTLDFKDSSSYDDFLTLDNQLSNVITRIDDKKEANFYIKLANPLPDGYYRIEVVINDLAGNHYVSPAHYLRVNYTSIEDSPYSMGEVASNQSFNTEARVGSDASQNNDSGTTSNTKNALKVNPRKIEVAMKYLIGFFSFLSMVMLFLLFKKRQNIRARRD